MIKFHVLSIAMLILGQYCHILKKVHETRTSRPAFGLVAYVKEAPYKFQMAIVAGAAGYLSLYETGQLTMVAALGLGYMADSALEVFAERAKEKVAR